jgi:hypothetical protein
MNIKMEKVCSRCDIQLGKCNDGKWNNYIRIIYYNSVIRGYELVYICNNCEPFTTYWKCTRCRKIITDINTEFCVLSENEEYFLRTCISCLKILREENDTDLNCNCLNCREINDSNNFIPK